MVVEFVVVVVDVVVLLAERIRRRRAVFDVKTGVHRFCTHRTRLAARASASLAEEALVNVAHVTGVSVH